MAAPAAAWPARPPPSGRRLGRGGRRGGAAARRACGVRSVPVARSSPSLGPLGGVGASRAGAGDGKKRARRCQPGWPCVCVHTLPCTWIPPGLKAPGRPIMPARGEQRARRPRHRAAAPTEAPVRKCAVVLHDGVDGGGVLPEGAALLPGGGGRERAVPSPRRHHRWNPSGGSRTRECSASRLGGEQPMAGGDHNGGEEGDGSDRGRWRGARGKVVGGAHCSGRELNRRYGAGTGGVDGVRRFR